MSINPKQIISQELTRLGLDLPNNIDDLTRIAITANPEYVTQNLFNKVIPVNFEDMTQYEKIIHILLLNFF